MKMLLADLKPSLLLTLVLAVLLCGAYPLAVWAGAQAFFPFQANGSLITDLDGSARGSVLLAQSFTSDGYFHPRPSAAGAGYDATSSSGTNLGPTSKKLADAMKPADTVAVAMHGDTVVLTTSGRLHVSVVPGGDAKSRSGNKGGSAELSAAWQGETLVVTTTSEKFRRETRYSLDGDRSRLRIAVTMRAEKLSQPIVYTLVYRRVG